jgi:hypothetical protein
MDRVRDLSPLNAKVRPGAEGLISDTLQGVTRAEYGLDMWRATKGALCSKLFEAHVKILFLYYVSHFPKHCIKSAYLFFEHPVLVEEIGVESKL